MASAEIIWLGRCMKSLSYSEGFGSQLMLATFLFA
jgi:hypothetical protein